MKIFLQLALAFLIPITAVAEDAMTIQIKNRKKCREEGIPAFRQFVEKKIKDGDRCKKTEDCVFLPVGEGYVLNRESAQKNYPCIHSASKLNISRCLAKFPGRTWNGFPESLFVNIDFPNYMTCEANRCVGHFGPNSDRPRKGLLPQIDYSNKADHWRCDKEAKSIYPAD